MIYNFFVVVSFDRLAPISVSVWGQEFPIVVDICMFATSKVFSIVAAQIDGRR